MWLLLAAALAAPPANIDPTEASQWDNAWESLFEGPPGCWEVVGRATWNWDFGKQGAAKGDAVFVGRLDDGEWGSLYIRSLGEDVRDKQLQPIRVFPHGEQHFVPLVGKRLGVVDERGEANTETLLDAVFDELGGGIDYTYSDWDDHTASVVLTRVLPIGEKDNRAEMKVWFPDGGMLPTYGRIDFPEAFSIPGMPLARVRSAQAQVRGRATAGLVFPEAESFSLEAGLLGFRVKGSQTIRYQSFAPCGGNVVEETRPLVP